MKLEKKYEISQKQLRHMTTRVERLKDRLERKQVECDQANQLVAELQEMYDEWKDLIIDLRKKRDEYDVLIRQVHVLKKQLEK